MLLALHNLPLEWEILAALDEPVRVVDGTGDIIQGHLCDDLAVKTLKKGEIFVGGEGFCPTVQVLLTTDMG